MIPSYICENNNAQLRSLI